MSLPRKMTRSNHRNSGDGLPVRPSLALNALLDLMQADRSYTILDLGPALGANISFWSRFRCRLFIEDFHGNRVAGPPLPEEGAECLSRYRSMLSFPEGTSFDLILAWDLFNYLNREQLEALVEHLGQYSREGTLMFAIFSILQQIPSEPARFRIVDRSNLVYGMRTQENMPSPRYQPRDIGIIMAGFEIVNSYLLRHGVQEYIFTYRK